MIKHRADSIKKLKLAISGDFRESGTNTKTAGKITLTGEDDNIPVFSLEAESDWSEVELKKAELQADEQKIKQLVLILVDNAVKYTPEGGQVTVRLEQPAKGQVRFTVKDTGIGIAPEDQARIFDRFFRVDKVRSREMGGNGLGLAIAHEIIKLHKGKISIQSELGEGTAFIVDLKSPKA